jgi:hypothetical protein
VNFEVATDHPQPATIVLSYQADLMSVLHIGQDVAKQSHKDCRTKQFVPAAQMAPWHHDTCFTTDRE